MSAFVECLTVESERAKLGKDMRGYHRNEAPVNLEMSMALISLKASRVYWEVIGLMSQRTVQ